jgi:hypothetical protein
MFIRKKCASFSVFVFSALLVCITSEAQGVEHPSVCHGIIDPTNRLVCYDRVTERPDPVSDRGMDASSELGSASAIGDSPVDSTAAAQPSDSPGALVATPSPAVPQSTPAVSARGLPAPVVPPVPVAPSKILKAEQTSIGRYRFHLENGEVWEQIESGRISVRVGDLVSVKEGRFGNWTLRAIDGSSRFVRVRRVQ